MLHPTVTARQLRIGARRLTLIVVFFLQLSAPVQAQDPNRVRMAYSAFSISFLNLFVARDAGLFKKHGIEIELIQMAGPLPVAALAAGEIDYLTGYSTGIVATGRGAPLKGIMISLRKPPFFLIAEASVQKPIDLVGKRIGVDRIGSLQHLVARLMLKNKGTDPEKAIFTQTGSVSNTVTSLGQGAVSAAILSGPHNVVMEQKGFRQIGAADELPMQFPTSGLVVSEAKLKGDPAQIKSVIRVMPRSERFLPQGKITGGELHQRQMEVGTKSGRNGIRSVAFDPHTRRQDQHQRHAGVFRSRLQPKTNFGADQCCRGDGLLLARSGAGGKIIPSV